MKQTKTQQIHDLTKKLIDLEAEHDKKRVERDFLRDDRRRVLGLLSDLQVHIANIRDEVEGSEIPF